MQIQTRRMRLASLSILLVFLAACLQSDTSAQIPAEGTPVLTASDESTGTIPITPIGSADSVVATESLSMPSPTASVVVEEMDWREAPIMPVLSDTVVDIYLEGQRQGRNPHNFSVIGDCQSIPYVFLGPFTQGKLAPDPVESYLWDAYEYFKASFKRWGVTSRGGFTAASILAPIQADPHYCKPGETPLTCEYRLNNPAYVFITLETWLDPATIDRYEDYLRLILDYVIAHGTIPILLTKADAAEVDDGSHVINPAIVRVARDYDVPLVNFWRAAQYLDNIGIDPDRDGFHLSQEGYDLKNILSLRALYAVWQAVTSASAGTSATPTPIAEEKSPPGLSSAPKPILTIPDCKAGCVFYGLASSHDGTIQLQGVFAFHTDSGDQTEILGEGYDLQDVSEDGTRLLVNYANYLFEADLNKGSVLLLSDTFYNLGKQGAYWNSTDTDVIRIDATVSLMGETGSAFRLVPSSRDGEVYFESGTCESKDFCQSEGLYRLAGDALTSMDAYTRPVFSPDGAWMAFLNPKAATPDNYHHIWYLLLEQPDRPALSRRVFYFPEEGGFMIYPDVREVAFSPDGTKLMVIYDIYSAYFEKSQRMQTYLLDLTTGILYDFGKIKGTSASLDPHLIWSPDGNKILYFLTEATSEGTFSLSVYLTDLIKGDKLTLSQPGLISAEDYFYITNLYWRK